MLKYQAEKISKEKIYGFKSYKLFKEKDFVSENKVFIIIDEASTLPAKSEKDLSSWLDSPESYERFFINQHMKNAHQNERSRETVLGIRKNFIMEKEAIFVRNLGLNYLDAHI